MGGEGPGREGKRGRGGSSVEGGGRSTHSRELKSLRCAFNIKKEGGEKMATAWSTRLLICSHEGKPDIELTLKKLA